MKLDEVLLTTDNLRLCRFVEETGQLIPSYIYTYRILLNDGHKVELEDITLQELYNIYTSSVEHIKELNTGVSHFIGSCVLNNSTVNLLNKNYLMEKGLLPDNNVTLQAYITYYDKSSWSGDTPEYTTPTDSIFYESGIYRNDYLAFQIAKLNKLTKDLNSLLYMTRRGDSEYYITTALRIIDRPKIKLYKKNIVEFRDYNSLMDVPITVFYKWLMDNILTECQKVSEPDEENNIKAVYTLGDTHKLKSYYENNIYEELKTSYGCFSYNNSENQSIIKGNFVDSIEFSNSAKKELTTGTIWDSASYIAKCMVRFGTLNPNLTLDTFTKRFVNSSESSEEKYQLYNEWSYGNFNDNPVILIRGIGKEDVVLSRKNSSVLHINTLKGDKPIALANIPSYNKVYDKLEDIPFVTLISWMSRRLSSDEAYDNFWDNRENPDYDIGTGENKPDDGDEGTDQPTTPGGDEWELIEGLAITPLPIPPTRSDSINFDNRGDKFLSSVHSPLIKELNQYVTKFTDIDVELAPENYVTGEGDEEISGVKNFLKLPVCSVEASEANEFANKRVVDQIFAKLSSKPKLYSNNLTISLRKYKYSKGIEYCWTYINLPANSKGEPVSPSHYDIVVTSGLRGGLVTLPTYVHKDTNNQGLVIGFPTDGVPRNLYSLTYKLRANSDRYQDSDEYELKWDYNIGKNPLIEVDNSININEANTMFPSSKYQGIIGSVFQLPDMPCGVYLNSSVLGYDPKTYSQDDETTSHGQVKGLRFTDIVATSYQSTKTVVSNKEENTFFNGFPLVKKQICLNSWIGMKSAITSKFNTDNPINIGLSLNNCRQVQLSGSLSEPETLNNLFYIVITDEKTSMKGYSTPKDMGTINGTRAQVEGLKVVPHLVTLKTLGITKDELYTSDIDVLEKCKFITSHTNVESFRVDMNRSFPDCKPYSGYSISCSAFDTIFTKPDGCVKKGSPSTLVVELGDSTDTTLINDRGDDRTTVRLRECDTFTGTLTVGLGYTNSINLQLTEVANGSDIVYTPPMNYIGIDRTMIEDDLYVSGTNNISVIPEATYKLMIDPSSPILDYFTQEYVNNLIIKLKVKPEKVEELKGMLKPNTYMDFKKGEQTYGIEIPFYTYYVKTENPENEYNRINAYMECSLRIDRALKLGVSQVEISSTSGSLLKVGINSSASINLKDCVNLPKSSEIELLPEENRQKLIMGETYPLYLDRNITVEKGEGLEVSVVHNKDNTIYNPMNNSFMRLVGYLYPEISSVIKSPDDEFPLYNSSWSYLKTEYPDETLNPSIYIKLIGQYTDELCGTDRVNTSYPILVRPKNVSSTTNSLDPTYYGFTIGKNVDRYNELFIYAKPISDLLTEGDSSYMLLYMVGLLNSEKADSYDKIRLTSSLELIKNQLLVTCSGLFTGLDNTVEHINGYLYRVKVDTSKLKAINPIQPQISVRKLEEWSGDWLNKHKDYTGEPVAISTQDFITRSDYQSYTYQRIINREDMIEVNVAQPQSEVNWIHSELPDMRALTSLYGYDLEEWTKLFSTYSSVHEDPIYQDIEKLIKSQTELANWIRVDRVDYTDIEQLEKRVKPSNSQYEIGISSVSTDIIKLEGQETPYRLVLKYNITVKITTTNPTDYDLDVLRFSLDETKLPQDMSGDIRAKLIMLINSRHVIRSSNNNLKIFYRTVTEN